jgi:hypothetical protein
MRNALLGTVHSLDRWPSVSILSEDYMNKVRLIGFIILVTGIIINYAFDYESLDFLTGILIGIGIGLIVIGRIGKPKV